LQGERARHRRPQSVLRPRMGSSSPKQARCSSFRLRLRSLEASRSSSFSLRQCGPSATPVPRAHLDGIVRPLDRPRYKCNDRHVDEGAAVHLDSAKAYFGVWAPRDCPSLQPRIRDAGGRRGLLLGRIRLRRERLASGSQLARLLRADLVSGGRKRA
jgi:hypothetical protein